jgi:hypothetical protein
MLKRLDKDRLEDVLNEAIRKKEREPQKERVDDDDDDDE